MFFKVILYFRVFSFCSKCIFVFFFKNCYKGLFTRSSRLRASREMYLRNISKVTFSYRKSCYCLASISQLNFSREMFLGKIGIFSSLYRGYRDYFMTKSFSRKFQYVSRLFRYSLTCEKRVFSVFM